MPVLPSPSQNVELASHRATISGPRRRLIALPARLSLFARGVTGPTQFTLDTERMARAFADIGS